MAAGGVEIVVGRPNKVQVVTLYGRPANLPGSLTKLVHAGGLIRLSVSGTGLGIPMSHGGKSFPSPHFPARDCYNPMTIVAASLPTTHVFSDNWALGWFRPLCLKPRTGWQFDCDPLLRRRNSFLGVSRWWILGLSRSILKASLGCFPVRLMAVACPNGVAAALKTQSEGAAMVQLSLSL